MIAGHCRRYMMSGCLPGKVTIEITGTPKSGIQNRRVPCGYSILPAKIPMRKRPNHGNSGIWSNARNPCGLSPSQKSQGKSTETLCSKNPVAMSAAPSTRLIRLNLKKSGPSMKVIPKKWSMPNLTNSCVMNASPKKLTMPNPTG